jgi:hypothetical protein
VQASNPIERNLTLPLLPRSILEKIQSSGHLPHVLFDTKSSKIGNIEKLIKKLDLHCNMGVMVVLGCIGQILLLMILFLFFLKQSEPKLLA